MRKIAGRQSCCFEYYQLDVRESTPCTLSTCRAADPVEEVVREARNTENSDEFKQYLVVGQKLAREEMLGDLWS